MRARRRKGEEGKEEKLKRDREKVRLSKRISLAERVANIQNCVLKRFFPSIAIAAFAGKRHSKGHPLSRGRLWSVFPRFRVRRRIRLGNSGLLWRSEHVESARVDEVDECAIDVDVSVFFDEHDEFAGVCVVHANNHVAEVNTERVSIKKKEKKESLNSHRATGASGSTGWS